MTQLAVVTVKHTEPPEGVGFVRQTIVSDLPQDPGRYAMLGPLPDGHVPKPVVQDGVLVGAVVYKPCSKCHNSGAIINRIGPNFGKVAREVCDEPGCAGGMIPAAPIETRGVVSPCRCEPAGRYRPRHIVPGYEPKNAAEAGVWEGYGEGHYGNWSWRPCDCPTPSEGVRVVVFLTATPDRNGPDLQATAGRR